MCAKKTNEFFDNMPQPAVAISAASATLQRWSADGESVGTLVAVNGTDVTTEAGGVVRSIAFEAGQPVSQGAVLVRLNTDNEEAQLKALETSAKLAAVQAQRWQALGKDKLVSLDDVRSALIAAAANARASRGTARTDCPQDHPCAVLGPLSSGVTPSSIKTPLHSIRR